MDTMILDTIANFLGPRVVSCLGTTLVSPTHILSPNCGPLVVSKLISLGILLFCMILKTPQIFRIVKSRSVDGLSLVSLVLETVCYSICIGYNLRFNTDFSAYGEIGFLLLQDFVLLFLWAGLRGGMSQWLMFITLDGLFVGMISSPASDADFAVWMSLLTLPVGILGGVSQINANFWQGHTGQLSQSMIILGLLCGIGRLMTFAIEGVSDRLMVYGCASGVVISTVLLLQITAYSSHPVKSLKSDKKIKAK